MYGCWHFLPPPPPAVLRGSVSKWVKIHSYMQEKKRRREPRKSDSNNLYNRIQWTILERASLVILFFFFSGVAELTEWFQFLVRYRS